jgi:hypothetical protein
VEIGGLTGSEPVRGTVGLQVGRIGAPLREWQWSCRGAEPGGNFRCPWTRNLSDWLHQALSAATFLRITPLSIIDKNNRESSFHGPSRSVLSAIRRHPRRSSFTTKTCIPKKNGFWVPGESTSYMTVAAPSRSRRHAARPQRREADTVTFATPTWGERVALDAGKPREVHVPAPARPNRSSFA